MKRKNLHFQVFASISSTQFYVTEAFNFFFSFFLLYTINYRFLSYKFLSKPINNIYNNDEKAIKSRLRKKEKKAAAPTTKDLSKMREKLSNGSINILLHHHHIYSHFYLFLFFAQSFYCFILIKKIELNAPRNIFIEFPKKK